MTDGNDDHGVTASADLATLIDLLDVERVDDDLFIGQHPEQVTARTFGGQLMGQGVVAAGRTITKGNPPVHALHAHFVRGGDVSKPLEYHIDRYRDGRAFANRQVTAKQDGEVVFTMLVAFQDNSAGLEHAVEIPEVPYPEELPKIDEHFKGYEDKIETFVNALHPVDIRFANDPTWVMKQTGEKLNHNRAWMKADGVLPDDPLMHVGAMAYSSDTTVLDSIITTHGLSWGIDRLFAATVNHSMWFHREFRFDEWMLYASESPVAAGSRGIGSGRFFMRDGTLATSVVQEALIKYFPPRA
ncbi:acyl-CoA thioesterase II [Gordonia sp. (in: high G+C Gram-positive bacteria)]|uniref:acyl-CoA thioesterase n=1 Tax=Gordonia sp. (in: high G+C Gram-positive bacteria) TaxID=84139 RepID=UPI00168F399B|nr:acyl-CoA thioesterase II [Gordonia sp. (in: high G+C Gram-positive bacteria)]NLG47314.1 acyl-CoA thioesterase II [Gordonia sp. (in: high G+C Gram-positive bacteria)]